MMKRLENRTALITGGGTGIGASIARLFAQEGAKVIVTGRRQEPLVETIRSIEKLGSHAYYFQGDVADVHAMQSLFEKMKQDHGPIDALVNAAGVVFRKEQPPSLDPETWQWLVDINLKGVYHTSKFALQQMLETGRGGTIVNISSILAHRGKAGVATYSAAKAGVIAYTRSLAVQYAAHSIRINSVSPGLVHTPMSYMDRENFLDLLPGFEQQIPLGRVGQPEDIAYATLFLSCDESAWITGQDLIVDGGASLD
jgi:NAD(P)-dependent dehydrogenase (short-subunit alcohol dehydrogenase family)